MCIVALYIIEIIHNDTQSITCMYVCIACVYILLL